MKSEKVRRVEMFARYEASQHRNTEVNVKHLLLGLIREDMGFVSQQLSKTEITCLKRYLYNSLDELPDQKIPLSSDAATIMRQADDSSRISSTEDIWKALMENKEISDILQSDYSEISEDER
ncbi:MAG TPA: Clp protease N-terminal domain-containing protein [Bacteroidia bacterium]